MKTRYFFACLSLTFCMTLHAQSSALEYRPFAEDGKLWGAQIGYTMENSYESYVEGDTIIGGETWKKVYNYFSWYDPHPLYYAAIRDEGKKVYAIARGSDRPRLLYDFGLKEGDVVKCGMEGNAFGCLLENDEQLDSLLGFVFVSFLKVERIDTVTARGMQHRRFTLTLLDAFRFPFLNGRKDYATENVVWIEGVGSGSGPFTPWSPLPPEERVFHWCKVDKTTIFGANDFYENNTTNNISRASGTKKASNIAYDFMGRKLNGRNKPYIKDGKKYMK